MTALNRKSLPFGIFNKYPLAGRGSFTDSRKDIFGQRMLYGTSQLT
jgi:hypothetical protein